MPPLQPFVPNVPLQVAKNLRFDDPNGIPVTQMLPIGMNGNVVADSPTTGYISRIGAVLSQQIDLYAQVSATLQEYAQDISDLDARVDALELSGTTIPVIQGGCFSGDALAPITTVTESIVTTLCEYMDVWGTASALTEAILAEGATALNAMPAFSQASAMAGLSGWVTDPETIADTINNLWKSYLDARTALQLTIDIITPTCSQAIVDFAAHYVLSPPSNSGFFVYFSGYSFIPNVYSDNGSTITITDGVGGVYTTAIDIVARSQPGADPLFVGISGTPLSTAVSNYQVTLSSNILSSSNSCTKVVIHNTNSSSSSTESTFERGNYTANISGNTTTISGIIAGLPYTPTVVLIEAVNSFTGDLIMQYGYYITKNAGGADFTFTVGTAGGDIGTFSVDWVAFR